MKNNFIALIFTAAIIAPSAGAFATDTASIKFTGKIAVAGCTVAVNDKSNNESMDMGTIDMSALSVGESTEEYRFYVDLSGCPSSIGTARARFTGTASSGGNQFFAVNGNNSANVGLEIKNLDGNIVKPNSDDNHNVAIGTDGTAKFTYSAQLVKLTNAVAASDFDVSAGINIIYE